MRWERLGRLASSATRNSVTFLTENTLRPGAGREFGLRTRVESRTRRVRRLVRVHACHVHVKRDENVTRLQTHTHHNIELVVLNGVKVQTIAATKSALMSAQPHGSRFKGTRSQLRLSDFFSKLPPQSPLKVARSARHNPPVRVPAALAMSETDNADDVIPSPRKRAPGDDERSRGHKRPRRDDGPSTHSPAHPHDQDRPLDLPTSHSCALPVSGQSEHSPPATVTRAQSVPAFLFSTPGAVGVVPRLDLTKVGGTPSPRRVHSSGKLRIRSIPPADVHVPPLNEDTENLAVRLPTKIAEASGVPRMELMSNSVDEPVKSGLVNSIPSPEIPFATHHTAGIQQTPRNTYPMNLDLGSPLTPLPPTPHPTKMLVTRGDRRPSRSGLRFELEAVRKPHIVS
jgi:hypothetical protein